MTNEPAARPYTEEDATDDQWRGYRGIPADEKLRTMSYVALCGLLADSESGSQKFLIVEAEKRRRDASPPERSNAVPTHTVDKLTESNDHMVENSSTWHMRPLGVVGLAVVGTVLAALAIYLIRTHFGLQL